jgi:ADP-ribosylglycohydrolase
VYDAVDLRDLLPAELAQRRESGHDVAGLDAEVARALAAETDPGSARLRELYDAVLAAPPLAGWSYVEPSTWPEIEALLPPAAGVAGTPDAGALSASERVHGAWLGRCAGCTLGKPVEGYGWNRERIRAYLTRVGAYPLRDYIPADTPTPPGTRFHPLCWRETTRGNIAGMARDDDVDYTIIALHLLEKHGFGLGPADVGAAWLELVPFAQTFTAERVAYRNLVCGRVPPSTAAVDNPYREWIGAQIRGDLWGYVCPGDPRAAARLAFADASLSHRANGIYGEMWVAALLASAATTADMTAATVASLDHLPPSSRLAEALRYVLELHAGGLDWDAARDRVEARFGRYSWLHTVNNAAVVALALLWGDGDFGRTVGLAVEGGWDTDSDGATAGSVFGMMHGVHALPPHWVEPLRDRVRSAVTGYDNARIRDLADRTLRLADARREG